MVRRQRLPIAKDLSSEIRVNVQMQKLENSSKAGVHQNFHPGFTKKLLFPFKLYYEEPEFSFAPDLSGIAVGTVTPKISVL